MPSEDVTALLGEWEAYRIGCVERRGPNAEGAAGQLWIELIRRSDLPMIGSGCGPKLEHLPWLAKYARVTGSVARLRELLAVDRRLATVYVLKDDLKSLWRYRYPC